MKPKDTAANSPPAKPRRRNAAGRPTLLDPKLQTRLLALHGTTESAAFLKAAVKLIEAAVVCDVVFVLLHYYVEQGRSAAVWGSDGRTFTDEYLRASMAANPHWHMLVENPGLKLWLLSSCYRSVKDMERCPYFKRYIAGHGMRHAVAMVFWNETLDAAECMLVPHRTARRPDFSAEELALLATVHAHIDTAYRRIHRLQSAVCARKGLESFVEMLPQPAILVDWELTLLFQNESARAMATRWAGADRHVKVAAHSFSVPAVLLAALEEMRAEWTHALRSDPCSRKFHERLLTHPRQPALRARLSMTPLRSAHFGKPSFLIRFEENGADGSGKIGTLTRLTPRERALALMVCDGKTNQEMANELGRNLNTVKSELHAVFRKLEIPSRARLMALLR